MAHHLNLSLARGLAVFYQPFLRGKEHVVGS